MKFKVGDKIVCVDSSFAENVFLNKSVLTVLYITEDGAFLKLNETDDNECLWSACRFRLATLLEKEMAEV